MPLFEFLCRGCAARSELLLRADDAPVCPACGSTQLDRQLSRITPMGASTPDPMPMGCGTQNCCQVTGGGCPN